MQAVAAADEDKDEESFDEDVSADRGVAADRAENPVEDWHERGDEDTGGNGEAGERHHKREQGKTEYPRPPEGFPEGAKTGAEHFTDRYFFVFLEAAEAGSERRELHELKKSRNKEEYEYHEDSRGTVEVDQQALIVKVADAGELHGEVEQQRH